MLNCFYVLWYQERKRVIISSRAIDLQKFGIYWVKFSLLEGMLWYGSINRFVVQSTKVPSQQSTHNFAQLHRATLLCIQLLDKENSGINNKLPSGIRLCFRIVRGYTEISVFLCKKECYYILRFIFYLANKIPLINLKFYKLTSFQISPMITNP